MTPNEAIAIVDKKAEGRTRFEGQPDFLVEVLVAEIRRLTEQRHCLVAQFYPWCWKGEKFLPGVQDAIDEVIGSYDSK